jgi:hypothetical protein
MASRFWVGGTGTWDASDTTHWASTTGGAGGQAVPISSDTVTFDGASGGGTVTVNHASLNVSSFTMSGFTGTIDFATNNNNITVGTFVSNGSATRTLNMGNGTWTVTGTANAWLLTGSTNMTLNANSSTLLFSGSSTSIKTAGFGTGLTYNIVTFAASSGGYAVNGTPTIGTLNATAPTHLSFSASNTYTITNALTLTGSSSSAIGLASGTAGTSFTLALGAASTGTWCAVRDMTNTINSFTFTNSLDLGRNTFTGGGSITAPSGSGSGAGAFFGA